MKRSVWTSPLWLLVLLTLLAPAGVFAQEAGAQDGIARVVRAWAAPYFWVFLLVVAAFGALGGLVYELMTLRGRLEMPHRADDVAADEDLSGAVARYLYDMGLLGRMIIGALAAIVVVWPLELVDSGPLAVISGSVIAGAAGIAVFRSLQDRLMAALATRELVKVQVRAAEQTRAVEEIEADVEQLRGRLQGSAERGVSFEAMDDRRGGAETPSVPESFPELDRITRKLAEARALGVAATGGRRESVRLRVYKVLSTWSGVPVVKVPPDGKKITVLWQEKSGNPQINEGVLSDLVVRLKAELPQAQIALVPSDLTREDGADTVGKLVGHVARSRRNSAEDLMRWPRRGRATAWNSGSEPRLARPRAARLAAHGQRLLEPALSVHGGIDGGRESQPDAVPAENRWVRALHRGHAEPRF